MPIGIAGLMSDCKRYSVPADGAWNSLWMSERIDERDNVRRLDRYRKVVVAIRKLVGEGNAATDDNLAAG